MSAQSVQTFGRLETTYIYTNVLFYYIDCGLMIQIYDFLILKIPLSMKIKEKISSSDTIFG